MINIAKKLLQFKSIRYVISGGTATGVDILVFFICSHYIFRPDSYYTFFISGPIASFIVSYSCGFITNFTISKLFVFKGSALRTRHQLMRYVVVAFLVFVLNYFFMKIFLTWFSFRPLLARIFSVIIVAGISYFLHNYFTFKAKKI